jgi:hypothetical protein
MKDEGASNDDDPTLRIYSAEVLAVLLTLIAATNTTAIISSTNTTTTIIAAATSFTLLSLGMPKA